LDLSAWLTNNRSLILRQTPFWAQSFATLLITSTTLGLIASFVFRIDEVISVPGKLISSSSEFIVESPGGGKVQKIFFTDGHHVKKGSLLLSFDITVPQSEIIALKQLLKLESFRYKSELALANSQFKVLQSRNHVLQSKLKSKQFALNKLTELQRLGAFQSLQLLEFKDQQYELRAKILESDQDISQLKSRKNLLNYSYQKSLTELTNKLRLASNQVVNQHVYAPTSGVVFLPKASVGSVISPGQYILQIIPQESFKAEVRVSNRDIGYIKEGKTAQVRVDSFPFAKYGQLDGRISQVGASIAESTNNLEPPYYPVLISLSPSNKTQSIVLPLRSGMSITANIRLRDRPIISVFTDLFSQQYHSLKSLR